MYICVWIMCVYICFVWSSTPLLGTPKDQKWHSALAAGRRAGYLHGFVYICDCFLLSLFSGLCYSPERSQYIVPVPRGLNTGENQVLEWEGGREGSGWRLAGVGALSGRRASSGCPVQLVPADGFLNGPAFAASQALGSVPSNILAQGTLGSQVAGIW